MQSLFLLYPPLAKNCEPPAGIARLAGILQANGVCCTTLDLNWSGLHELLRLDCPDADTWSRRAKKHLGQNLQQLQQPETYRNFSKYQRTVADINRVLSGVGRAHQLELSLANYQEQASPVQSDALLNAAENYQDNIFYPLYKRVLLETLEKDTPDFIGISISYLSQAIPAFALIGFLQTHFPAIPVIIGGGLVTSWIRSPNWNNPFNGLVDYCIAGPGEEPLLALLTGTTTAVYAPPVYDQTRWLAPGFILPYAASTGCYWNKCLFCPETAEENPYQTMEPDMVVADLAALTRRYKPMLIHFLDNAISPALMRALVETPPGVPWYSFARAGTMLADVEFCRKLRKAGCVMLKLGLESGDQQVLDSMHKGIDLALVSQVLAALKTAGILTYVYLLFGTPAEDRKSAVRTMEFTARHHEEIGFLNLAVFNLPLGGPEVSSLVVNDFYKGDLSLYTDFVHPKGWSRQQIRYFLSKDFKRHPDISPIIQRDPPFFTSNHAAFFHPDFWDTTCKKY
jgi:hypothetical protein